jgi:hypothetical protein
MAADTRIQPRPPQDPAERSSTPTGCAAATQRMLKRRVPTSTCARAPRLRIVRDAHQATVRRGLVPSTASARAHERLDARLRVASVHLRRLPDPRSWLQPIDAADPKSDSDHRATCAGGRRRRERRQESAVRGVRDTFELGYPISASMSCSLPPWHADCAGGRRGRPPSQRERAHGHDAEVRAAQGA